MGQCDHGNNPHCSTTPTTPTTTTTTTATQTTTSTITTSAVTTVTTTTAKTTTNISDIPSQNQPTKPLTTIQGTNVETSLTPWNSTDSSINEHAPSSQKEPLNTGLLVGVICGGIVIFLVIALVCFFRKRKMFGKKEKHSLNGYVSNNDRNGIIKNDYEFEDHVYNIPSDEIMIRGSNHHHHSSVATNGHGSKDIDSSTEYTVIDPSAMIQIKDTNVNKLIDNYTHSNGDQRKIAKNIQTNKNLILHHDMNEHSTEYAVLDPSETGYDRRNHDNGNNQDRNEYLELDPNETGFNRRNNTSTNTKNKDINNHNYHTIVTVDETYELAKPTSPEIGYEEQRCPEQQTEGYFQLDPNETGFNRTQTSGRPHKSQKSDNQNHESTFLPNKDYDTANPCGGKEPTVENVYSHTVDDVYDVSSHSNLTKERDSTYDHFTN